MSKEIGLDEIRFAFSALPEETAHGVQLERQYVYLPSSHRRAMDPDNLLVTGSRGAGKTFWWQALQDSDVRSLISRAASRSGLSSDTIVRTGFGVVQNPYQYPSKDAILNITKYDIEPRIIWRTVLACHIAPDTHPLKSKESWLDRTRYAKDYPEIIDRLFFDYDIELDRKGEYFLVLFDALDRCADDWRAMYRAIRGLLQTALEMRSYKRLRVKVFLRTDQVDRGQIADFPDATKVLSTAVELDWSRRELYGLLWHCLANGPKGAYFRKLFGAESWLTADFGEQHAYAYAHRILGEGEQREKFHEITGPWMGRGPKRGFPYTWIPNHLADTDGRVSPRSFFAALREAAEHTTFEHPGYQYALHFESIKSGVQKASEIRVGEISEDYPWVDQVLAPLEGLTVPCEFEQVKERWLSHSVLENLSDSVERYAVKLPPQHLDDGAAGVRSDLEGLGVFFKMRDGRVNIPDVFRVGYRIGRRGGVRPARPS